MTIEVKIVADSIGPCRVRLTTFQLRYPRFVHSEFMTHKMFSKCASSSRAIPVEKMLKVVQEDPAVPVSWGKNQKGMQASEDVDVRTAMDAEVEWLAGRGVEVRRVLPTEVHHGS